MADFTAKAIRSTFLELIEDRPYKDVTVKDIVKECDISRSSFYYHFQDIPTLLESIILEEMTGIMEEHSSIDSIDECIELMVAFTTRHKKAALHLYNSVKRDTFEQYLWKLCDYAVGQYVDTVTRDRTLKDGDRELLIKYFSSVSFGIISRWHMDGARGDIRKDLSRILELRAGQIDEMIRRSEADNN